MSLEERVEALTQSVELLAAMHRDYERAAAERAAEADRRAAETDRRLREMIDAINTLGRIAGLPQDRLDEHGERLDNLER